MAYEAGQSLNTEGSFHAGQTEAFGSNKLVFDDDYDGQGTDRRFVKTNGSAAGALYTGQIDHLVVTGTDPRYTDAANAPPVLVRFEGLQVVAGAVELTDSDKSAGSLNSIAAGTTVWGMAWNADYSFNAIFTIKVLQE